MKRIKRLLFILLALAVLTAGGYWGAVYLEKRTYRLDYAAEILQYTHEFGGDPYLAAAVIHCESGGRAAVTSPKGAVGLMQIMPDTGGWIAEKLAMTNYDEAMLVQPAVNIRFGCWYLAYLNERFAGRRRLVAAAYNAGPGRVGQWLEDPALNAGGELTAIPYAETENYVTKVERAYEKYQALYQDELG